MATTKIPAHLLKPGDIVRETGRARAVVLCLSVEQPGLVSLQLARLGEIPEHLDRVATARWTPMDLVNVERPDLSPAQQHADTFAKYARKLADECDGWHLLNPTERDVLSVAFALAAIDTSPPTLEETLAVLDRLCIDGAVGPQLNEAERLLRRARLSGVLPRG